MPFQFYCPQGHLLEGHESQMGQQSQCPMCGTVFLIPMMTPQPGVYTGAPQFNPQMQAPGGFAPPQVEAPAPEPQFPAPPPEPEKPPEPPRVVRIPCPNGHELETPSDMFGQQALCPYCNVQFELRYEDSVEHKEEQVAARHRKEEEFNKALTKWAIRAAMLVGGSLLLMILYTVISSMFFSG